MPLTSNTTIPRQDLNGSVMEFQDTEGYLADWLAPGVEVGEVSGRYGYISASEFYRKFTGRRNADGSYERSNWALADDSFQTVEYGHEELLDDRQAQIYASYADFERARATRLRAVMRIMREVRVQALIQNITTWPLSGNTGLDASSNPWSDRTNSLPISNVATGQLTARNQSGFWLDSGYCTLKTWWDLSLNAQIRDSLKYTQGVNSFIPLAQLAAVMNLKEIRVANCLYNNANDGAASSLTDIWSDSYFGLVRTAKSNSIEEPCVARSFYWTKDGGGTPDAPNFYEYISDPTRGSVLRARHELQEKKVTTGCHFLIKVR